MLDAVRKRLRISHHFIDDDINEAISEAQREMIRNGIRSDLLTDDTDELIRSATITYCMSLFAPVDTDREGYRQSWLYQLDNLRKSPEYNGRGV